MAVATKKKKLRSLTTLNRLITKAEDVLDKANRAYIVSTWGSREEERARAAMTKAEQKLATLKNERAGLIGKFIC